MVYSDKCDEKAYLNFDGEIGSNLGKTAEEMNRHKEFRIR
jgi:hypothetical protein